MKNLLILSSPSGGGKSTVARFLLEKYPKFKFSISATTRTPRPGEKDGKHYYFLDKAVFEEKITNHELVEYEEIFGNFYGTLRSKTDEAIEQGKFLLFDVDVKGALSLQKCYPENSLLVFLSPPDVKVLEARLRGRNTETEEQIQKRLARFREESAYISFFDHNIVNNVLDETLATVDHLVRKYFDI